MLQGFGTSSTPTVRNAAAWRFVDQGNDDVVIRKHKYRLQRRLRASEAAREHDDRPSTTRMKCGDGDVQD
jgi:hypothetical protein